jgi:hypothetical protein
MGNSWKCGLYSGDQRVATVDVICEQKGKYIHGTFRAPFGEPPIRPCRLKTPLHGFVPIEIEKWQQICWFISEIKDWESAAQESIPDPTDGLL